MLTRNAPSFFSNLSSRSVIQKIFGEATCLGGLSFLFLSQRRKAPVAGCSRLRGPGHSLLPSAGGLSPILSNLRGRRAKAEQKLCILGHDMGSLGKPPSFGSLVRRCSSQDRTPALAAPSSPLTSLPRCSALRASDGATCQSTKASDSDNTHRRLRPNHRNSQSAAGIRARKQTQLTSKPTEARCMGPSRTSPNKILAQLPPFFFLLPAKRCQRSSFEEACFVMV